MPKIILGLVGETNVNRPAPNTAFEKVQPLLDKADVLFGHMETTVSEVTQTNESDDTIAPDLSFKKGWKHSKPENLSAWKNAGFDAVGCASNVTGSADATLCQIKTLDALGLSHAGVGRDLDGARKPAIIEKNGVRFGFLSYTSVFYPQFVPAFPYGPGAATVKAHMSIVPSPRSLEMPGAAPGVRTWLDDEEKALFLEDIARLRPQVDHMVLSMHWGVSSSDAVQDYQKELGHLAIDNGVDAVMGTHPHRPQGIEIYNGRPIFYSLGNFCFDWWFVRNRLKEGIMAYVTFEDKAITKISFATVCREDESNDIAMFAPDSSVGSTIVGEVSRLSEPFGTKLEITGDEIIVRA